MAIAVKTPIKAAEAPPKQGGSEAYAVLAAMEKEKERKIWMPGNKIPQSERIPTGVFEFDVATGGGFPRGRVSLVFGKEASDKTNLTLRAAAQCQRQMREDNKVAFIDLEGTFDPIWAGMQGVDTKNLIVVKPGYGEEASDILDALAQASDIGMVILDSVAVMSKSSEIDNSSEKQMMGGASATLMNQLMRKLAFTFSREAARGHNPAIILINQPRIAVGPVPVVYLPGGKLQIFQSSLSVRVTGKKRVDSKIDPMKPSWLDVEAEIIKSKVGVTRTEFKYSACLVPHEGLGVGMTNAWTTVMAALKSSDDIKKVATGWQYAGKVYPTLLPIADLYEQNPNVRAAMQKKVIELAMKSAVIADKGMASVSEL